MIPFLQMQDKQKKTAINKQSDISSRFLRVFISFIVSKSFLAVRMEIAFSIAHFFRCGLLNFFWCSYNLCLIIRGIFYSCFEISIIKCKITKTVFVPNFRAIVLYLFLPKLICCSIIKTEHLFQ